MIGEDTAQNNIKKMPEMAMAIRHVERDVVAIKPGETGCYTTTYGTQANVKEAQELADLLNERLGVTKGMAEAMYQGSMFGYGCAAANPDNYNADGSWNDEAREWLKNPKR